MEGYVRLFILCLSLGSTAGFGFADVNEYANAKYVPAKLPSLCKAGPDSLSLAGAVYNPAIKESPEFGGVCKVNDFDILESLGAGGYGAVTLVKHRKTGKKYAMKIFRSTSTLRYGMIRSEECHHFLATSPKAFSHMSSRSPYIAQFHCSMTMDKSTRFLVEYVEGETLMAILTGGAKMTNGKRHTMKIQLKDIDFRRVFAQLVLAIEHLHDKGIVFGDLTARNIMINTEGNLKLIDFGFSKIIGKFEQEPPRWPNGPKQALLKRDPINCRYAVGCILYEMAYAKKLANSNLDLGKPRDVRMAIQREAIVVQDCMRLVGSKATCDLINHFIKGPWEHSWGRTVNTRKAIREHEFFKGFDWNAI